MESLLRQRCGRWVLFILGWAALSLLFAPEAYLSFYLRHSPMSWRETLQLTLINSAIGLLFIPAIVALTRRYPIERSRWQHALLHVPACVAFSGAHSVLYAIACHAWQDVGGTLFYRFHPNLLTYWAVVGFTQAYDYFRKYQAREREITQLELEVLKAQLHPHFLFNTLHTISSMMHVDVKRADRMVSRLSELLRVVLANIGKQEVRLAEEIGFVKTYLEIERERFGERLALEIDVTEEALNAFVPALFLQPLVENCVRHGFIRLDDDSVIAIHAHREEDRLVLTVSDNGQGISKRAGWREGVGITNSRRRLQQLYPDNNAFRIEARNPNGVIVTTELPFHTTRILASLDPEVMADEHLGTDRGRRALGADPAHIAAEQ